MPYETTSCWAIYGRRSFFLGVGILILIFNWNYESNSYRRDNFIDLNRNVDANHHSVGVIRECWDSPVARINQPNPPNRQPCSSYIKPCLQTLNVLRFQILAWNMASPYPTSRESCPRIFEYAVSIIFVTWQLQVAIPESTS